ncbi:6788_t:CDS:2 [Paraglomus brasilianum]|uniref:6788_t:CDS:1 n=1 Tax=Paraglomus brasilianum TaxID=144538 RepID=A0A9N8YWI1_9GLOM|nr:6788_t:CDS:2 [Paraglomus brasilianum]
MYDHRFLAGSKENASWLLQRNGPVRHKAINTYCDSLKVQYGCVNVGLMESTQYQQIQLLDTTSELEHKFGRASAGAARHRLHPTNSRKNPTGQ